MMFMLYYLPCAKLSKYNQNCTGEEANYISRTISVKKKNRYILSKIAEISIVPRLKRRKAFSLIK